MAFLGSLFGKKKSAPVAPPAEGFYRVPLVRFENKRDQHVNWREVVLDGKRLFDTFGATDLRNQTTYVSTRTGRRFKSEDAARVEFEARVNAKHQWLRKERLERDLPRSRWPTPPPPSLNAELEARVDTAPPASFDAEARVYTDWLVSQGDPRGELAALLQAGTSPDAFLSTNAEALLGQLDVFLGWAVSGLEWRGGLLHGATLSVRDWEGQQGGQGELTADFLKLPVARFVRSLRFGLSTYEGEGNDWSEALLAAGRSDRGRFITAIHCDVYDHQDSELSWTAFGDLSGCWVGLPALETLVIRAGGGGELGEIDLPALRALKFESGGMDAGVLDSIVRAKWPNLERLEVWTGHTDYGSTANVDQLSRILNSPPPRLTHLGLVNSEFGATALQRLVGSPLFSQLKSLDLSLGILSDDNVEFLLGLAPQLNKLDSLDLHENLLKADAVGKLKTALPRANLDEQRDSTYRYVAVGE